MANFNTHIAVASGASFIASLGVYTLGISTIPYMIFMTLLGILGGILPDIDAPRSTAAEWIFNLISGIVAFVLIFSFLGDLGVLLALFIGLLVFILIK